MRIETWTPIERKTALILAGIAGCEGIWVYFNIVHHAARFGRSIGLFLPATVGIVGWVAGLTVAFVFVLYSQRIPAVRQTLFEPSRLKMLGLIVACGASLCEEVIFRKLMMNGLRAHGDPLIVQIFASSLAFGLLHSIWGLMSRNLRTFLGAMTATSLLGGLLAIVYLLSHRVLLSCIVAHFAVDAFTEPGLVLAGLRGEMGSVAIPPVEGMRPQ